MVLSNGQRSYLIMETSGYLQTRNSTSEVIEKQTLLSGIEMINRLFHQVLPVQSAITFPLSSDRLIDQPLLTCLLHL